VEDPEFTVVLTGPSAGGPAALRAVRAATGLSLWRSKQLLNSTPVTVRSDVPFHTAVRTAQDLRQAGVAATVRCNWCRRVLPDDGTPVDPGPCTSRIWPTAHCQANSLTTCDCEFCTTYGPLPGHTAHRPT
jgi:hypothetical protein